jgi:hypothetical protein
MVVTKPKPNLMKESSIVALEIFRAISHDKIMTTTNHR